MSYTNIIERFASARRGAGNTVLLEGLHACKHALRFGATLTEIYATDSVRVHDVLACLGATDEARTIYERAVTIKDELFRRLATNAHRTGLVALADKPDTEHSNATLDHVRPVIYLENPRDTNNVGAVVRVAAAFGAAAVVVSGTTQPWHAHCVRTSAGLHFALPVLHNMPIERLAEGRMLVACTDTGSSMYDAPPPSRSVLIFGSERYGVSQALLDRATTHVGIPMQPGVSSMNLATSVAAILYGGVHP